MVHRMKELREKCKFSKEEVAHYLRIPVKTYEKLEEYQREPRIITVLYLTLLYGVTADYFLGKDKDPVPKDRLAYYRYRVYPKIAEESDSSVCKP